MERLVEVRDSNGNAYEMRGGTRVEYAMTVDGQHKRMRALGCPEIVLVRAKRRLVARYPATAATHKPERFLTETERDAERKRKAAAFGATIVAERQADSERQQAADAEQQRKDAELAERMRVRAGRVAKV
jgi:hypothetical protein